MMLLKEPMTATESPEMTPEMKREELQILLQDATEIFSVARAKKSEIDLIYVAAANRLNSVERVVTKMNQRAVLVKRQANLIALRAMKATLAIPSVK